MEVPQAPAVVSMNFEGNNVEVANNDDLKSVWCYGEGKDNVLHGKWVQNYRVGIPWIEGGCWHSRTGVSQPGVGLRLGC